MATIGTVEGILRLRDEFTATLNRASEQLEQTGRKMQRVGRQMQATGAQLTAAVTLPLAAIGAAAVKMAADAEEAANKFNVVMGESADDVRARFLELRDTLPLTLDEMERLAAGVQDLLVPFGVAREQAAQMSANMVELAGDVASFNNVSPERVLEAISSALAGSSEPMRRFGVDTRVARLEALALSEGLVEVGQELDSTATAQAVLLAIQRDSTDAMGDAARTVDSTANQMRFLARDVREATQALGDALIPVARSLIGALRPIVQAFADLSPRMRTAVVAVGALAAAIGPLIFVLGTLVRSLGAVAAAASGASAALARMGGVAKGLTATLGRLSIVLVPLAALLESTRQTNAKVEREFQKLVGGVGDSVVAVAAFRAELERLTKIPLKQTTEQQRVRVQALRKAIEELERRTALTVDELKQFDEANVQSSLNLDGFRLAAGNAGDELADLANQFDATGDSADDFDTKIQAILDELFPVEAQIRATEERLRLISEAMSRGTRDADELREAYQRLVERLLELDGAATEAGEAINLVVGPGVTEGIDELADDVSRLSDDIENQNQNVRDQAAEWIQVGQAAAGALGEIDSQAADVLNAIIAMTAAMIAFNQAATAAATAVAALNIATAAFALFSLFAGGGRRTQVSGPIPIGPGGAVTEDLSEEMGFAIGSVREEFGKFLEAFNAALRETMQAISLTIPEAMEPVFFEFEKVFKDGQLRFVRVVVDGVTESFDTAEEALGFALQKFLQAVIAAGGQVDEAVRQIVEEFAGDPAQFQDVLRRVQGLADQALMALDGLSAIEIELRKLPSQLQALRQELTQLGLSAAQVERLVGGQLVASLQAARQAITGEELSVEARRAIQKQQALLFNAERALRIAELKARRAELLAKAGFAKAEIEIITASARGLSDALKAKGQVYNAEVQLILDQVRAINKILEALAKIPEIDIGRLRLPGVPRIRAPRVRPPRPPRGGGRAPEDPFADLQGLLDRLFPLAAAMRNLKDDTDLLTKAFEAGRISQRQLTEGMEILRKEMIEALLPGLQGLVDRLQPARARLRQFNEESDLLKRALKLGQISAEEYKDLIALLTAEFDGSAEKIEKLRGSLETLREFRLGLMLRPEAPIPVGRQLLLAQQEFARQARIARETGDVAGFTAAADALIDLARGAFGSTAGFQKIFRDVTGATEDLEAALGSQLEDLRKGPAEQTARRMLEVVGNTLDIVERFDQLLAQPSLVTVQDPIKRIADSSAEGVAQAANTSRNTAETRRAVERVERATKDADERNQVSIGRIQFEIRKERERADVRNQELIREFKRAIDRIAV